MGSIEDTATPVLAIMRETADTGDFLCFPAIGTIHQTAADCAFVFLESCSAAEAAVSGRFPRDHVPDISGPVARAAVGPGSDDHAFPHTSSDAAPQGSAWSSLCPDPFVFSRAAALGE